MITVTYNYLGCVMAKDFNSLQDWYNHSDLLNPFDNPFVLEVLTIKNVPIVW